MIGYRLILVAVCLLVISPWVVNAQVNNSSPIRQGTVEISTLGSLAGLTSTGSGANFIKADDMSITTLGLNIGYFATKNIELEGGIYIQRVSFSYWGESSSDVASIFTGKLAFNFPSPNNSVVPYAFGGVGLINPDEDSETLYTFGGGIKIPLASFKMLGIRLEYSYTNSMDEESSDGLHSINLAFSAFFNVNS